MHLTPISHNHRRIAYFSPLPPTKSGISDYSRDLLPFLAELADITLFVDNPELVLDELRDKYEVIPCSDYPSIHHHFDLPLYHLGNSRFHKNIYQTFTRFPGVVVLHDYLLHHFFSDQQAWGNIARYQRELGYCNGLEGTNFGWQRILGEADHDMFYYPLNGRVFDLGLGLIAHSQFVANKVNEKQPKLPVVHIPQPMPKQAGQTKRAALPFPEDAIIFASIGLLTFTKQLDFVLHAFAKLVQTIPDGYFLIVGDVLPDVKVEELIEELNLKDRVYCTGYANSLQDFVDWTCTADVIVNLRYPTVGETSATALRAMALGKPVIVFDHGWYAELPENASIKLPILDEDALLQCMMKLATNTEFRQQIGIEAVKYIETVCHPKEVAQHYIDFLNTIIEKYGSF